MRDFRVYLKDIKKCIKKIEKFKSDITFKEFKSK